MTEKNQSVFQQPPQKQSQDKLESVSKQTGFEIPVESVILPSKGILYALDHPLANEVQLEIKCMTAKEEDLLTSRALIKNGTVISKLLESCILNKSVVADDMLVGDRNALLVAIRVTGYGASYSVKISCPECDEEFENDFSLNKLNIKPLTAKSLGENLNLFSYILPLSGQEVQFKLLTGKDEAELTKISERKKKLGNQIENIVTSKLFQSIISVSGETDRQKIGYIVNNLRAGDARALRKHINDISPDVDMKQWAKCTQCGEESEVEIPLGITFFWPDFD